MPFVVFVRRKAFHFLLEGRARMSRFRALWQRIRSVSRRQFAFVSVALALVLLASVGFIYTWDYTNSPVFCGTTCHTMPPEYSAYQVSPHARVSCVECHLGRDIITTTFTRKAGDLMHVIRYSSGDYTFPVFASSMLPARESCEKCHWPEKFANDRAVTIKHYSNDEKNTQIVTYLLLKTGGGTAREGLGLGIHWHIENQVYFISTDDQKQNIPWVQVVDGSGKTTTYVDVQNPLSTDQVQKAQKQRMDCIDCHNRISHTFRSPAQAVDQALSLNRINSNIPSIHEKAIEVLTGPYKTAEDANKQINALDSYYSQNYPDFYKNNSAQIKTAIDQLKSLYQSLVYPTQQLSWDTHPDNIGHKDWPGCFRCHDGKHLTQDNKQAIRLECNLCHSLPEVATPGGPAPVISMIRADEPASHLTTTWLAQHRTAFDATCQNCHDTDNAGGKDNSSFCSNSACHGTEWRFAGLNAVALSKIFPPQLPTTAQSGAAPEPVPHPIGGSPDCLLCHGPNSQVHPFPVDHTGRTKDMCLACHKPAVPLVSNTAVPGSTTPAPVNVTAQSAGGPPKIPHDTAGRTGCLGCHGSGVPSVPQVPQFHKDANLGNGQCLSCHKPAVASKPAGATPVPASPTAKATPTVTATWSATASTVPTVSATLTSAPTIGAAVATPTAAVPTATVAATKLATLTSTPSVDSPTVALPTATTAAPQAGGPPAIPASHAGRTGCVMCHAQGLAGAPQSPANHEGRTEDTCKMCHQGP